MRFLILIAILLALDLYAFQAIKHIAVNWSTSVRSLLYSVYWLIPAIAISAILIFNYLDTSSWNRNLIVALRTILFIAYISKFLMVSVLFIDDLRRLIMAGYEGVAGNQGFDKSRSRFLSRMAMVFGGIPFLTLTYGIIRNPYRYKLFRKKIKIKNLPHALEGLKIVQISDIHSGSFTLKEPVQLAIDMINEQKADLVFFTGDLVNNVASEMHNFMDIFGNIKAKYGVFSVLGNHDYGDYVQWENAEAKRKNMQDLKDIQKGMGWDLLLNEHRTLQINNEKVAVLGVENYSTHLRFPKHGDLQAAHTGSEDAALKLLLSHDPSHWESQVVNAYKDIDITFSGHTHGMQFGVEIPGLIKWSPIKYMYKQWAGLYQQGKQYLYVNRGLGFLGYPGRVGILPEISVLELERDV
ncbi:MAG: metallophosphoesterase [Bacteroidetes bacterium]|nr:metallophosphoesterase [Bacteroidota bacterium]